MAPKKTVIACVSLVLGFIAQSTQAQFEYQYEGNFFDLFSCDSISFCPTADPAFTSYTTADFVRVSLILDARLPGNLQLQDVTTLPGFSLTINDGQQELTFPTEVLISTDGRGNIIAPWSVISNGPVPPNNGIATLNWPGGRGIGDVGTLSAPTTPFPDIPRDQGLVSGSPGTWNPELLPRELTELVIDEIEDLVADGSLQFFLAQRLLRILDDVLFRLDRERSPCQPLSTLTNLVEISLRTGQFPVAEGQLIIDLGRRLADASGCPTEVVIPNRFTWIEAPSQNRLPWFPTLRGFDRHRYQQVYAASEFGFTGPRVIRQIAFRPDTNQERYRIDLNGIEIRLSTTQRGPDGLSVTNLDLNPGDDETIVFDLNSYHSRPSDRGGRAPSVFDDFRPAGAPVCLRPGRG